MSSTVMVGGYLALFAATNLWALRDDRVPTQTVPVVKVVTDADVLPLALWDVGAASLERVDNTGWQLVIANDKPLVGSAAIQAVAQLLPIANRWGGSPRMVRDAVHRLEALDDPQQIFAKAVRHSTQTLHSIQSTSLGIALEIAAHEAAERVAMEGELALLERAWQEAETVAAIADGLLVPEYVNQLFARIKGMRA